MVGEGRIRKKERKGKERKGKERKRKKEKGGANTWFQKHKKERHHKICLLGETKGGSVDSEKRERKRKEGKGMERKGKEKKRKERGEGKGGKERKTHKYLILRFKNTRKKEHQTG